MRIITIYIQDFYKHLWDVTVEENTVIHLWGRIGLNIRMALIGSNGTVSLSRLPLIGSIYCDILETRNGGQLLTVSQHLKHDQCRDM